MPTVVGSLVQVAGSSVTLKASRLTSYVELGGTAARDAASTTSQTPSVGPVVMMRVTVAGPVVSGIVDLSGLTGFGGVNALPAARKLRAPALFVAGRDDGSYAIATRTLYRAAASKDKKLLLAPTSWHGVDLVSRPEVKKAVLAFVARVS